MSYATTAKIVFTVRKAEGLVALNPGGTSNPYVTVTIGTQSASTPVMNKTINPLYDSTFTFMSCQLPTIITLSVLNKLPYVDVEDPLGSATITLFSLLQKDTVVQLSHGGNASLAQRAPEGCGKLYVSYEATEMPAAEATGEAPAAADHSLVSKGSSSSNPPSVPLVTPPAISIAGTPALPAPTPYIAGTAPTNYSVTTTTTTPNGTPSAAAAALPPPAPSPHVSMNAVPTPSSGSLVEQLTPPMLSAARPPATAAFLVPQCAPAPPETPAPVPMNTMDVPGFVSYPVPGVRTPPPVPVVASAIPSSAPQEMFYANNALPTPIPSPWSSVAPPGQDGSQQQQQQQFPSSVHSTVALAPTAVTPASAGANAMPPVISGVPNVVLAPSSSLHGSAAQVPSPNASFHNSALATTPNSSLYSSAANAPALALQKMMAAQPSIDGFHQSSQPMFGAPSASLSVELSNRGVGQLVPPMLSPNTMPPASGVAQAGQRVSPTVSPGALPVAVAPRSQPLSASTSTSRTTTPSVSMATSQRASAAFPSAAIFGSKTSPLLEVSETPAFSAGPSPQQPPPTTGTFVTTVPVSSFVVPATSKGDAAALLISAAVPVTASIGAPHPAYNPNHGAGVGSLLDGGSSGGGKVGPLPCQGAGKVSFAASSVLHAAASRKGQHGQPLAAVAAVKSLHDGAVDAATTIYADRQYLFEAAASGSDVEIFKKLRAADPLLVDGFAQCVDYAGRTLLHIAAWHGQLHIMQILLSNSPAPPVVDLRTLVANKSGNTILHATACGGQVLVAQWLRYTHPTAGPLLLNMRNYRGMTAAECAKEAGFDAVARLLMPN